MSHVLKLDEPKGGKTKQDVTIADVNTSVILTIGKDMLANSRVDNRTNSTDLCELLGGKFPFSLPPSVASIEPISDIGNVVEDSIEMDVNLDMLLEAKVIGVYQ